MLRNEYLELKEKIFLYKTREECYINVWMAFETELYHIF